jgi:hypothetical protein
MNFISEKPSWHERVALGRIATSTLCVSAVRLRCSSRDLTWVTLSQIVSPLLLLRYPLCPSPTAEAVAAAADRWDQT